VKLLRNRYDLSVFIEPGAGVVRDTCFIVASVVDLLASDGKALAILDTTVNHIPEVFEYQFSPTVLNESYAGRSRIYLQEDMPGRRRFWRLSFDQPLEIGSRVIFSSVGSYSFVKSHMFNGFNLPTVFSMDAFGRFTLRKQFTYEDFRGRLGSGEIMKAYEVSLEIPSQTTNAEGLLRSIERNVASALDDNAHAIRFAITGNSNGYFRWNSEFLNKTWSCLHRHPFLSSSAVGQTMGANLTRFW